MIYFFNNQLLWAQIRKFHSISNGNSLNELVNFSITNKPHDNFCFSLLIKMIKKRLKSWSSIRFRRWNLYLTEIDDQNRPVWNLNRRQFDAGPLIAEVYQASVYHVAELWINFFVIKQKTWQSDIEVLA